MKLTGYTTHHSSLILCLQPDAPKNSDEYLSIYREEWREVFIIAAEVYFFGTLVYILLGSGKKQPWADAPKVSNNRDPETGSDQRRANMSDRSEPEMDSKPSVNQKCIDDNWELDKPWKIPNTVLQNKKEANGIFSGST